MQISGSVKHSLNWCETLQSLNNARKTSSTVHSIKDLACLPSISGHPMNCMPGQEIHISHKYHQGHDQHSKQAIGHNFRKLKRSIYSPAIK